jgi:hypothetical protein
MRSRRLFRLVAHRSVIRAASGPSGSTSDANETTGGRTAFDGRANCGNVVGPIGDRDETHRQLGLSEQTAQHRGSAPPQRRVVDDGQRQAAGCDGPAEGLNAGDDRGERPLSIDPVGDRFVVAHQLHAVRCACMRQPFDPFPAGCAGGRGEHDHVEIGGAVGDARLHDQGSGCCSSLGRSTGETDATLIDQVDENGCGWQHGQIAAIGLGIVVGCPSLIGETHAEHEGVVVGRPPFPQVLRQLGCASDDLGKIEMGPSDALQLVVEGEPCRVGHNGRWWSDFDATGASAAALASLSSATIGLGLRRRFVAWPTNEVELPE